MDFFCKYKKRDKKKINLRINWERGYGQIGCPGLSVSWMNFSAIFLCAFSRTKRNAATKIQSHTNIFSLLLRNNVPLLAMQVALRETEDDETSQPDGKSQHTKKNLAPFQVDSDFLFFMWTDPTAQSSSSSSNKVDSVISSVYIRLCVFRLHQSWNDKRN